MVQIKTFNPVNNWWGAIAAAFEDGYIAINQAGQIVAFNPSALEILQISEAQMEDPDWWKSTSAGALGSLLQEQKEFVGLKIRQDVPHKKDCWLHVTGKALHTSTETGYILTFRDVTGYLEINRSLNTIISSLDDIILEMTIDGIILHVWMNRSARLTLPWMEMQGKSAYHYMPDRLKKEIQQLIREVVTSGKEVVRVMQDPLDGDQQVWYRIRLLKPGTANNTIILSIHDVTAEYKANQELKEARTQLEDSQQVFKSVFDYSPTGIALLSLDGQWLDVNTSLLDTLGYTHEEMLGMSARTLIHPDDLDIATAQIQQITDRKINSYRAEQRYRHHDGHYIYMYLACSAMLNPDETIRYLIVQMIDVTELKHLDSEARKKNIILHATSIDLQQKIKQLFELNQIIAHNLRGPATALISSVELLPELKDMEEEQALLNHMKNSANSIINTLNDLKEVLAQQANTDLPFTQCDLEDITSQLWSSLNQQVVEKNAQLNMHFQIPVLFYCRPYLENILFHLINNALTYTRPEAPPEITIGTWQDEDQVVLMVKDNGIGIDLQKHGEQLFRYKKKFHRGYESKGVGLFMVRNQIRTFGGSLDVKSEVGKGSSFFVYFNNRVHITKEDE
ncbi:PAS domain S-box protein [Chitinophaga sancti]|uniref:PAS domain S-box protein n=1 Tax=Chitinophaga sancti TaxID=1004 RepID=UPI002A75DA9F|nr:PAS domain S-box protein [Chitinophaga sancti]WPQ66455.1 PAS domain S-box protein [Chitinophaga sancti]